MELEDDTIDEMRGELRDLEEEIESIRENLALVATDAFGAALAWLDDLESRAAYIRSKLTSAGR